MPATIWRSRDGGLRRGEPAEWLLLGCMSRLMSASSATNVFHKRVDRTSKWINLITILTTFSHIDIKATMPTSDRRHIEGRISLAIAAYHSNQVSSLQAASRAFDVPFSTLRRRVNGTRSRRDTRPLTNQLTSTEEEVLLQRILHLDHKGFPPRLSVVGDTANIILASRDTASPTTVGKNWSANFVKRQPLLRTKYRRTYDYQRSQCADPAVIKAGFLSYVVQ
jgi:hypothetical protein